MGSSGKTRTTFAKLSRESKLREKRDEKEARKAARKLGAGGLRTASPYPALTIPDGSEAATGSDASHLPGDAG